MKPCEIEKARYLSTSESYDSIENDMSCSPLVSIIIPTYNRVADLPTAIHSALSQTYPHIEIIVVDDGSTDKTEKVVAEIARCDHRVKYFCYHPNRGGNVARNIGLDMATGQYVTFLDSDDIYLPEKIEAQIDKLPVDHAASAYIVQCQLIHERNGIRFGVKPERGLAANELPSDHLLFNGGASEIPLLLIPTSIARRVRFNEHLPKHQDTDWFIRVCSEPATHLFVEKPLAVYNITSGTDKVSRKYPDHNKIVSWVEEISPYLSEKGRTALLSGLAANYAARTGHGFAAIRLLFPGLTQGLVSPRYALSIVAHSIIPSGISWKISAIRRARKYRVFSRKNATTSDTDS